jgi:signal transduction histidine kinase
VEVLAVVEDEREATEVQSCHPGCVTLLREGEWVRAAVVVAGQMVRRVAAQRRADAAENAAKVLQRRAALGRYMLEMRADLNDALTSALGNADLLLLESTGLRNEALDHVRTLHRMVLRLNEMVQRFSSLACELQLVERPSQSETEEEIPDLMAGTRTPSTLL